MSVDFSYRPSQSETIGELAKALNKVQAQLQPAAKNGFNPHFKSNFADLPSIVAASKDALAANGLSVVQMTGIAPNGDVELVTTLLHVSGEWMRGYYPIRSTKGDPQSLGSAFTYARRYTYQGAVGIVAADDDDGNAASGAEGGPLRNDQGGVRPKITQADVDVAAKNAVTRLQTGNVGNRPESSFATAKYPPTDKQVNFLNSLLRKHGIPEYHGPEAVKRLANSMYTGGKEVRISIDALKAADDCPSSLLDLVFVEEAVEEEPEFTDGDLPY